MFVHGINLIDEPCIRDITRAARVIYNMEIDGDDDGAIRVDSSLFTRTPAPAAFATACGAMAFYFVVDLFHFEVIDVTRAALSAGIDESLVRLKNNAVGSYDLPVFSVSRAISRVVLAPLRADVFGGNADQQERKAERK